MAPLSDKPTVFAKFLKTDILGETGRLLFSLLNAFSMSGYRIMLCDNLAREDLGKYGKLVYSLENVCLTDIVPANHAGMIYLYDGEDRTAGTRPWRKKVQVKFDVFSPYWFADPIFLPFPVHPVHAGPDLPSRLKQHRLSEKKIRIFFSGETKGYVKNRIHYPKDKLPRLEVINTILERMDEKVMLISEEKNLESLYMDSTFANKCVLVDTNSFRIDDQKWLGTLAKCDFFLCPPGYIMPMCHNAVEAMAVGAIPIINYSEWFNPSLTHLENCIVFDDKNDLIEKLNCALQMSDRQITEMRQRVIDYYETHLTARSFVRKVETSTRQNIVVLMITEPNAARNASKLNKYSILIRGTSVSGWRRWFSNSPAINA